MSNRREYSATGLAGKPVRLDAFRPRGFYVRGFPCHQFGKEEPGRAAALQLADRCCTGLSWHARDQVELHQVSGRPGWARVPALRLVEKAAEVCRRNRDAIAQMPASADSPLR